MRRRRRILQRLAFAICAAAVPFASAAQPFPPTQTAGSASEALQLLLDRNIQPPGPLGGDGATIAGVLAGQSLTFPIASSSGAFVRRTLVGFGPPIPVSTSGNFGSLFAERGLTNGRGNLSVSLTYQNKAWRSISGINLSGFDLQTRAVFRNDVPGRGPAGTVEQFAASIDFDTSVVVLAANYGVTSLLDVGIALPYVRANVDGVKRVRRDIPRGSTSTLSEQRVIGQSEGLGDAILRFKHRIPLPGFRGWVDENLHLAAGYDLRLPTGRTADLFLDCARPPCVGGRTQSVPDVGLGKTTHKWSALGSVVFGRISPHINAGYVHVPSYRCDARRFGADGACRGSIFELDPLNGTQDAKNQDLANEWNATAGVDYELVPYRATMSVDVIGRQLIRAGQFYEGEARATLRGAEELDRSVATEVESRHGNVNTLLGVLGLKVSFLRRWVFTTSLLFPLNDQGLQPSAAWVLGLERAVGR